MRHFMLLSGLVIGTTLALTACGGGAAGGAGADTTAAKIELAPIDELKAIQGDLQADVDGIMQPINDAQTISDDLAALTSKYKLSASDVAAMVTATVKDGTVSVGADLKVADDARVAVDATMKKLKGIVTGLKATPEKAANLLKKAATLIAKVPVLAGQVTAKATVAMSNPFGGADAKVKAKADLDAVKTITADVQKQISDVQAKLTSIPSLATSALTKLTASLAGGASTGG